MNQKNISISVALWLLALMTTTCSGCGKDSNGSGTNKDEKISVTIQPTDNAVVESNGGTLDFTVTPSKSDIQLRYISSVDWMKRNGQNGCSWTISANTSELSRDGRIYILNQQSLAGIDTIYVVQKAKDGNIQEPPSITFTEADVPILIPYAGNSFISEASSGSESIGTYSGRLESWREKTTITSTWFRVGNAGKLNLAVVASNASGNSVVRFTVHGQIYPITISGPTPKIYAIASLNMEKPGYVRVDMQGISRTGPSFGDVSGFRIGGQSTVGKNNYITQEWIDADPYNCYFARRGASTHWFYALPTQDVEYFYNEVLVTKENAIPGTYYQMNGFSEGYMGIQVASDGSPKILFSVWSPYSTDNPNDIPEHLRIKTLRQGANVTIGEFGNEGSGGQSWLLYRWKTGVVYKALVQAKPDGAGNTDYTAYFYADDEWKLIATFRRPQTNKHYTGAYSFLESFDPVSSIYYREVLFRNQWAYTIGGQWIEITNANFSCDNTGRQGIRYDFSGAVDNANGGFVLKDFGFKDEHTDYGVTFTRKALGIPPQIDFAALEQIPSIKK